TTAVTPLPRSTTPRKQNVKYALLLAMVLCASAAQAAPPEGIRTPPSPYIADAYGGTWTVGSDAAVLRNVDCMSNDVVWQLFYFCDTMFALTRDGQWQRFIGSGWVNVDRDPQASVDGTRTPPGALINDNYGGIWTIGSNQEVLRNGYIMSNGY